MTVRRIAALIVFGAFAAWGQSISPTVLPSSQGCTPPSNTVACSSVGANYSAPLTPTNIPPGSGTPTWSFAGGVMPPGLGIDPASGVIAGSPTVAGLFTFTVGVTYPTMPTPLVVTAQYSIAIAGPKLTIVAPLSLPNGTAGVAINATVFTASGGVPFIDSGGNAFYHWSIAQGPASQADGLVMDQNSGTLTGTPLNAGVFSITIGVLDAVGVAAIHIYTFNVSGSNGLTITTTSLPGGIANVTYSQNLLQTGGPKTGTVCPSPNPTGVCWSIISGNLPPGLNISSNADGSGTINGTPTAAGTYNFTVQASYQVTNLGSVQVVTGTAALSIIITTQLSMANPTAVSGFVNQQLTMQFTAVNGTTPYNYTLKIGNLPTGMSLNAQTGAVSGQPTQPGSLTFTIQVTDATQQTATAQGTITTTILSVSPTLTPTGTVTAAGQQTVGLTLGTPPGAAISGTLTLTFANATTAAADNPEVRFSDGTRKVSFSAAADGTVTLPAGLKILTGTVAGTGTLVATFTDSLGNVLSTSSPATFTVPATVPVITSFAIACSGTTYTVTMVGYSSTLDMASLTLNFTAASGVTLATPSVTVQNNVPQAFASWWSNPLAAPTGSQFTVSVSLTFTATGGAITNPIVAASGAATNAKGASTTTASTAVSPACP